MSEHFIVKLNSAIDKNNNQILKKKLESYNLGKEFNFAVVVLKLLITNGVSKSRSVIDINLVAKVHYVTPFISEKLAKEYCEELSKTDAIMMLLKVKNGKIIVNDEDISKIDLSNNCSVFVSTKEKCVIHPKL